MQNATVVSMINIGLETLVPSRDATVLSLENLGHEALLISTSSTVMGFENIGVAPVTTTSVTRGIHGWGVTAGQVQTYTVLNDSADATVASYENITS